MDIHRHRRMEGTHTMTEIPDIDAADIDDDMIADYAITEPDVEEYPDGLPVRDLDADDDEEEE